MLVTVKWRKVTTFSDICFVKLFFPKKLPNSLCTEEFSKLLKANSKLKMMVSWLFSEMAQITLELSLTQSELLALFTDYFIK